jgi:TIR domain
VTVDRDFFVSFTGPDRPWAEWLVVELDAAGYSSVSQLRDFVAGANFALAMDEAARRARRTLGVLSPRALGARYVRQEWTQRLATDPTGKQRDLVLVRVEPCEPEGMLQPVLYIDLVNLDEAAARARLLEELEAVVRGRRQLPASPEFPGRRPVAVAPNTRRPRFRRSCRRCGTSRFVRIPSSMDVSDSSPSWAGRRVAESSRPSGAAAGPARPRSPPSTPTGTEYAYRYRAEFDVVWWVRADQPVTLVGDYAELCLCMARPVCRPQPSGAGGPDRRGPDAPSGRTGAGHRAWSARVERQPHGGPATPDALLGNSGP